MLTGLDRSIAVLKGESPAPGDDQAYSFDPADAGANLSETDRTEAVLHSGGSASAGRWRRHCGG